MCYSTIILCIIIPKHYKRKETARYPMNQTTSASPDFHDIHISSIQVLRGITAIFIVLEHIRFLSCGAFGVDIFFCISGFMIMFSTHKSTQYFLRKRIIRIVPLYYVMTIGTFALLLLFPSMFAQTKADPIFLIKSLLFIPFDIGGGILQPLMRIGWTVNCEIFFYVLFLIALKISHKYRGLICSGLLVLLVILATVLPVNFAPLTFYGAPVMLEFIFGIVSYYIARSLYRIHCRRNLPGFLLPLCIIVSVGLFLVLMITKPMVNILGFRRPFVWGIPAFILVLCIFIIGLLVQKLPDAFVRLGNISFSLYLMHYYPVMLLDRVIFDFSACTPFTLLGTAVALATSVILALICHEIVEIRFTKWLRKKFLC